MEFQEKCRNPMNNFGILKKIVFLIKPNKKLKKHSKWKLYTILGFKMRNLIEKHHIIHLEMNILDINREILFKKNCKEGKWSLKFDE